MDAASGPSLIDIVAGIAFPIVFLCAMDPLREGFIASLGVCEMRIVASGGFSENRVGCDQNRRLLR